MHPSSSRIQTADAVNSASLSCGPRDDVKLSLDEGVKLLHAHIYGTSLRRSRRPEPSLLGPASPGRGAAYTTVSGMPGKLAGGGGSRYYSKRSFMGGGRTPNILSMTSEAMVIECQVSRHAAIKAVEESAL